MSTDTPPEWRVRYLESQRRYNTSPKGQRRNLAYEARNPQRKLRWEPARNALHGRMPPPPDAPMHDGADLPPEPGGRHSETTGGVPGSA